MTEFRIITTYDEFLNLSDSWDDLVCPTELNHVFMKHIWFKYYIECYELQKRLSIVTLWQADRLTAIAPLMRATTKRKGIEFKTLKFISSGISPRCNFISRSQKDLYELLDYCLKLQNWDLMTLDNLELELNQTKLLQQYFDQHRSFMTHSEPGHQSPYLSTHDSWNGYLESLSRNRRRYLKNRLCKRLEKAESFHIHKATADDDPEELHNWMLKISDASWKYDSGSAISQVPPVTRFYRKFTEIALKQDLIVLWFLDINGEKVAFDYYLKDSGRLSGIRSDYDKSYGDYYPGDNIKLELLKQMFADPEMQEFDFGGSDYDYKLRWTNNIRKHINLIVGNKNLKGRGLLIAMNYIKPIKSKLSGKSRPVESNTN